nr:sushi, von Willebrand factor type A, EGF and pentraxin domain-containing protein 1-like [Lytechinus pictus]
MMKLLRILLLLLFLSFESTLRSNAEVTQEGERFRRKLKEVFDDRPVSELVFVLDSSGSVIESDFYVAVDFVNIASTLVSVSESTTRIAVISYSGCDQIYTRVDYITSSVDKNKCTFGRDLESVVYDSGGTCTAGALQRGREVLANARLGAHKVLMLLTDGSSNDGGSPTPNAELLKGDDVLIFTIGIGNINRVELNTVATNENEYVYILADFGDISKLGAVTKQDIRDFDAYFDIVQDAQCDRPCDDRAVCACATRSGSTGCACEAGFTGDENSCQECPIGTYKTSYGNGPCDDCPMHSTTTSARSSSRSDCYCDDGYEGNPGEVGGTCQCK